MADRADAEELPRQASPVRNPGSAVYGVVLADSLLAIEGDGHVGVPRLVLTVLATQCVYWLAHIYAELVGGRIVTGRRPHRGEVGRLLAEEWPMVTASFGPLAVTLVAWALGAPVETAVLW